MNIYHIWATLKPGVSDIAFCSAVEQFLGKLRELNQVESWRITRRKLGLGDPSFLEFHIMVEFNSLDQLDKAFGATSERTEPVESFHYAVNSKVSEVKFSLYRDFPDAGRKLGNEKF